MMFAPTMDAPRSPLVRRALAAGAGLLLALSAAPRALAQQQDQVFRMWRGEVAKVTGIVTENTLETVRLDREGRESTYDGGEVLRIVWGEVPPAFTDGRTYASRKDHENAVARFRVAATGGSARDVVQAAARLEAARALMAWGAEDPNRFAEAVEEVERFLADHPNNREVPEARRLKARAQHLAGDAAGAATTYQALYEEGASDPPAAGYDRLLCLEAGLSAARAHLAAGEADSALDLFQALEDSFRQAALEGEEGTERHARLQAGRGEAAVGEGWCLLVRGEVDQAARYFESRVDRAELGLAGRSSARLGLGEALLAQGEPRRAQIQFAQVSALDHTSRDRVARAQVGLASAAQRLASAESRAKARRWLENVVGRYGDTPAAHQAAKMLEGF